MDIKQQLSILYLIEDEKTAAQISINSICDVKSPSIDGQVICTVNSSKTERYAIKIIQLREHIKKLDELKKRAERELSDYIKTIDDSIDRAILHAKYIEMQKWSDIGKYNTKESIRKRAYRCISRHYHRILTVDTVRDYYMLKNKLNRLINAENKGKGKK